MDFGLKDIGLTFIIGTLTILGLDLILFYLVNVSLTGFYSGKLGLNPKSNKPYHENLVGTSGFVLLSFCIGVIVEDVSYKFMDPSKIPLFEWVNEKIPMVQMLTWFKEHEKVSLRYNSLVSEDNNKIKPQELGAELARLQAFTKGLDSEKHKQKYKKLKRVEDWFLSDKMLNRSIVEDSLLINDIKEASRQLYYTSKNTVYLNDNYYDEMNKIQNRIDLSRSIVVISFIYILLASIISVYALFRRGISIRNYLAVFLTLILAYFLSKQAYDREAEEFNKRAYGYYSTLLYIDLIETIKDK